MSLPFHTLFLLGIALLSLIPLVHTYLLYPWLLRIWEKRLPKQDHATSIDSEDLPRVSVLMAAHNEEKVLPAKLKNLADLDYPQEKLFFFLGSDASTDRTDQMLRQAEQQHPSCQVFRMEARTGKPGLVNFLAEQALGAGGRSAQHILLLTDASIFLDKKVIHQLALNFSDPRVALVDTVLTPLGALRQGVSISEKFYLSGEARTKYREGRIWGCTIGPFGGCFALRSTYFHPIPDNFLVDDFFLAMKALENGGQCRTDPAAVVREPATHSLFEEFRRKVRISTGNFQNLVYFRHLWWPPNNPIAFAFFSHKILRWLGPAFLLLFFLAVLALFFTTSGILKWIFSLLLLALVGLPVADWLLHKAGINIFLLRSVRYFVWMNLALAVGAINFLNGVESNVWKPTERSGEHL